MRTFLSFCFRVVPVLALCAPIGACTESSTQPPVAGDVRITAHTTGGIAGMDWTVVLDGATGELRCAGSCPWDGDEVRRLTDAQVETIAGAFVDAGIRTRRRADYGICALCADQFHHVVEYRDGNGTFAMEGDGPNLPDDLHEALNRLIFAVPPAE